VLGAWLIEENEGLGVSEGIDVMGAVLVTSALMLGVYGIVTAADYGWASPHTLGFAGIAVVLLAAFVALERRIANPILPMRVLALRDRRGAHQLLPRPAGRLRAARAGRRHVFPASADDLDVGSAEG